LIVVDTNVIAALYLPNENSALAEALLLQDADWAAPALWRSELRNVLALYLRKKMLNFEQACQIQNQAESLMIANEYQINSVEVLRLAQSSGCSAYDCEFVALARHLGVKLVTQDKQILAQFPQDTIALKDIEIKQL
jgi:predicted nucleic acid-binding protein